VECTLHYTDVDVRERVMNTTTGSAKPLRICGISQQDTPGAFDRVAKFNSLDVSQQRALFTFLKAVDPGMTPEVARKLIKCFVFDAANVKLSNGAGEHAILCHGFVQWSQSNSTHTSEYVRGASCMFLPDKGKPQRGLWA
jgi:hypothetical protein